MPTRRGDKWEGRLKINGKVVQTRRFDTKRAAADVVSQAARLEGERDHHREMAGRPRQARPRTDDRGPVSHAAVTKFSPGYGDLVLILGRTGLRWGEARALQVKHFSETPMPMLQVVRNQPEGSSVKAPKSGKGRNLPVPDYLVPVIQRFAAGKTPNDLLFTNPNGGQLFRTSFVRAAHWDAVGRGRSLHVLRHTAACEWLIQGVPLTTVQAWLGHGSIQVTARYLHHLGDYADRAALDVLNKAAAKTTRSARARKLPDLSISGTSGRTHQAPERTRGLSR